MAGDKAYQEYYGDCRDAASRIPPAQARWDGFIPESKLGLYYSAADVVVFPHTAGIASSGTLSLAIAYGRPFVVSRAFQAMVGVPDVVFDYTAEDLERSILAVLGRVSTQEQLENFTRRMRATCSWERVGRLTSELYLECRQVRPKEPEHHVTALD